MLWFAAAYKSNKSSVCYLAAAGSVSLGSESGCHIAGGPVLQSSLAVGIRELQRPSLDSVSLWACHTEFGVREGPLPCPQRRGSGSSPL